MTLPLLLVAILVCVALFMRFNPQPKKGKPPKKPKRRLPLKGPFRVRDNPFKAQYARPRGLEFEQKAYRRATEQLLKPTDAENALEEIIIAMGFKRHIHYEREFVFFYANTYCIFDEWFPAQSFRIEADGSQHSENSYRTWDQARDIYLKARYGITTLRLKNKVILTQPKMCCDVILSYLDLPS